MRKVSIMCLLATCLTAAAGEPETAANKGLSFRGTNSERSIIKLKTNALSGSSYMREDGRESHGPGFFANLSLIMPATNYMDPYAGNLYDKGGHYKAGVALEFGNYFRLFHTDKIGLGIRASWLQIGYNGSTDTSYFKGS